MALFEESLAQEIVGKTTDRESDEHARRIAEAQIDLKRIRQARHHLLVHNIDNPECGVAECLAQDALPQGPQKIAAILSDLAKQLTLMERAVTPQVCHSRISPCLPTAANCR